MKNRNRFPAFRTRHFVCFYDSKKKKREKKEKIANELDFSMGYLNRHSGDLILKSVEISPPEITKVFFVCSRGSKVGK